MTGMALIQRQNGFQNGEHFGLSIMQARAARIDGAITIDSQPGQGTRIILRWPAREELAGVDRQRPEEAHTQDPMKLLAA